MNSIIDLIDMIHSLYNCESCDEFVELWNAFDTMHEHGFIIEEIWSILFESCSELHYDYDRDRVVNLSYI